MGSVGLPAHGYARYPFLTLAHAIDAALRDGRADRTDPALNRLLAIRDLGVTGIEAAEEPLAFCRVNDLWCVREGIHRTIALSMLGEAEVEGVVFESGAVEG